MINFLIKKLLIKEDAPEPSNKELFDGAIFMAQKIAENNPDDIKCLMRTFGRKIQYEYFGNFFCHVGIERYFNESTRDLRKLTPEKLFIDPHDDDFNSVYKGWFYDVIQGQGVVIDSSITADLSKDIVLPWPWKSNRMIDCLHYIGEGRKAGAWEYDDTNHRIDYWEEVGVFFVDGGNHSITTGILKGTGKLPTTQKTSMKHMYDHIYCDGNFYYRKLDAESIKLVPVRCLDFAILYEIGRIVAT